MYVEFIHVANKQEDPAVYAKLVEKAAATGRALILECWDVECAKAALAVAGKNVILDGATPANYEAMNAVATEAGLRDQGFALLLLPPAADFGQCGPVQASADCPDARCFPLR